MTLPGSTILVTGADGRFGNVLVRQLLQGGYRVRAGLHPHSPFGASLRGVQVERVPLDVTCPEAVEAAVQGCGAVMHLASVISLKSQDAPLMEAVNVAGTRHLLQAARRAGVRRFLYAGSCDAYQVAQRGALIDETAALALNDHNAYNRTKAQATQLALGHDSAEMTVLAIAPSGITGPNDFEPSLQTREFIRGTRSRYAPVPAASFNYVDVRDLSATFIRALTRGRGAQAYLAGGENITEAQAVRLLRMVTGRGDTPVHTVPVGTVRRALILKAALDRALHRPDDGLLMSLSVLANEPRFDSGKAARELGHHCRPVQESLTDLGHFLQQRGLL